MDPNTNLNDFLEAAKAAISDAGTLSLQVSELRREREESEIRLNTLKKRQADQIETECRKRRTGIDKTYDAEIGKCDSQLKKAQNRRDKAKNQGIRERIADETADLKADIKTLNAGIRNDFKANKVPAYCNSRLFCALYLPEGFADILIILIAFAAAFFLIPYGIYKLFFNGSTAALIIIYILDVLLFGGLYIAVSRHTVVLHNEVLRRCRSSRRAIAADRKEIEEITRRIKDDTSESCYDLAKYDDEIAHIRQQLADITMKKNDALSTFENVTKNIIADEITGRTGPEIDEAQKKLSLLTARFSELEEQRKQKAAELSDCYEVHIGKEFMNRSRIEKIQEILKHGTATTIKEAEEEYSRQYDI